MGLFRMEILNENLGTYEQGLGYKIWLAKRTVWISVWQKSQKLGSRWYTPIDMENEGRQGYVREKEGVVCWFRKEGQLVIKSQRRWPMLIELTLGARHYSTQYAHVIYLMFSKP